MSNSSDAKAWSKKVEDVSSPAKFLLLLLADRVGDNGFIVWPSIPTLAKEILLSGSTVRRLLKELAAARHVEVLEAWRDNGGRSSNRYRLMVKVSYKLPGGQIVEVDAKGFEDLDPPSNLTGGGCQFDRGAPVTADRGNMNSSLGTESGELDSAGGGIDELPLGLPPVPTEEDKVSEFTTFVEESWAALRAECPQVRQLRGGLGEARAKKAMQLARDKADPGESERDVWEAVFRAIRSSHWQTGEKAGRDGRVFKLQMTWLLEKRNFDKTIEGKFEDERSPDLPASGQSRRSPAGAALSVVLSRRRAGRERRAGGGIGGGAGQR